MAVRSSSIGISCCGFPPSHPLSLSHHSQHQFSLQACSPIPMLQLPAPLHTCEHMPQSGACRASVQIICVFLTLSHLLQIGQLHLLPQMLPFYPNRFAHWRGSFPKFGNLFSASAPPPLGAGPVLLPLLLPSFFCPTQLCRDLYSPLQCPRSSASLQLVFC